ncbi:LysR family transcriptional regulator [Parapusillimonas granuli]|uniref:LysR family transcriptional regulator n=1 Tax=Parapusillimonas granuli TaxID=380911 RepID=A0A853G7H0_9BURK|nr:LysR family transcriptional regulator [Parapusillimonas granuli]MBB5214180.1 DNA-binding transcriptional LysR family regulator [Parapusillimonas granuli]NYT50601.1 LysR family transcriptional regulator [Parapusillimonas granuli]
MIGSALVYVKLNYLNNYAVSLMKVSGRLIEAFLALVETRRFSLAAQRCHVSPSAFSQMIGRLEEQVGTRLFDRDTRKVALTQEGEIFLQGANRVRSIMSATLTELQARAQCRTGRVAVAAPFSLAAHWMPSQMSRFRTRHPDVDLYLHDVLSDRCLRMIADAEVDFGVNARTGGDMEFESQLIFNERMYLICSSTDTLAAQQSADLSDLRGRAFIHILREGSVWQLLHPLLQKHDVRDSGHEVAQLATLAGLISHGFGVSILPHAALDLCRRPGLAIIPLSDERIVRPIYLVKRRQRSLSPAAAALWMQLASEGEFAGTMVDIE